MAGSRPPLLRRWFGNDRCTGRCSEMMHWIIGSSLRLRLLVVPVAAGLMLLGITQLRSAPVDVLPEFNPPLVDIQTEALGLSAEEVAQLVTVPLEQDLLNGVAFIDQITSHTLPGLSRIELILSTGTDVLKARQLVQERLVQAPGGIPNVSKAPSMLQPLSSTGRVMMIGLSSKDVSLIDMSVLARWKIRPRLMGVPGVANVAIWGQRERQLQVQVDPRKLRGQGISLDQVIQSTANALWVSPLSFTEASTPGTGGFIDTSNQRLGIQHISPITTAKDLSRVTVEGTGAKTLRLGDVSQVVEDHQPLIGDAIGDSGPGLMLVIQKFPGASTREVTRAVEAALEDMRPGLSGIVIDTSLFRPADFIDTAIHNLALALLIGLVIMIVLLGGFLLDWRVALISLAIVPLSLVMAAYVLYLRGVTFNTMLLAGLAIALGVVVDDAIVDVDNIRRRLQQHPRAIAAGEDQPGEESKLATILRASLEVRGPLLYATLIIALATAPIFFVKGLTGSFVRPLAISYLLAILVSMLVAPVVTPGLALLLFGNAPLRRRESPLASWLERGHTSALTRLVLRPRLGFAAIGVIALAGIAVLPAVGGRALLPPRQDRDRHQAGRRRLPRPDSRPDHLSRAADAAGTDRQRRAAGRPCLRPGHAGATRQGGGGAPGHRWGRRGHRAPHGRPGHRADRGDRGQSRRGRAPQDQAGRRAPGRGHAAVGRHRRQPLRGAEGIRRGGVGRATDPPQPYQHREPAGRHARRRPGASRGRGQRARRAEPDRHQPRRHLALCRRHRRHPRALARRGDARRRAAPARHPVPARAPCGGARNGRRVAGRQAMGAEHRGCRRDRDPPAAAGGLRELAPGGAGLPEPAPGAGGRRAGRAGLRWPDHLARLVRRAVHAAGHRGTEQHPAGQALPASPAGGRRGVRRWPGPARGAGTARADRADRAGDRAAPAPVRVPRRRRRPRGRASAGRGHPGRPGHRDGGQPPDRAVPVPTVRAAHAA